MNEYFSIIILPALAGTLLLLVPERVRLVKGIFSLLISIITFWLAIVIYSSGEIKLNLEALLPSALLPTSLSPGISSFLTFNADNLAKLIIIFISLFGFLILLYSIIYIKSGRIKNYYEYFLLTLGCSYGAVLSDNLLVFITFWGILGITLYKLIQDNREESSATAKKTLILIGASDSIMIIGIAILWKMTGSLNMSDIQVPTGSALGCTAFLAMIIGSFTKAGAFPFHTWVPDYAKDAPVSSSAYLPASLDKLLGIYFLARILTRLFVPGEWMTLLLLTLGVATIITAVMMALIQHNYKQLLGYHAVSQVGYMILGLSLGSFIGIAAGLFHMVNHALYKSGLFLSAGAVEHRTGKNDIDDLGGLSNVMPVTFFAAFICAMSISGIPPLNGFASKWMIYQAIIDFGGGTGIAHKLWVLWLVLAVLGSALTLARFIKIIGGIFL
ncbi:MAG: complex I subunit 5 family protein [Bacteroidales bacterium]